MHHPGVLWGTNQIMVNVVKYMFTPTPYVLPGTPVSPANCAQAHILLNLIFSLSQILMAQKCPKSDHCSPTPAHTSLIPGSHPVPSWTLV